MIAAVTDLTLYLRLQSRPCRVIPFPIYPVRLSRHTGPPTAV